MTLADLWRRVERRPAAPFAALAGVVGALLLLLRPASPFEWDEVLFMRAAQHYDASRWAPHAPGYPGYALLARLARFVLPSAQLATQLVAIAFAAAVPLLLWSLARRLDAPPAAALAAAVMLAVAPAFAFNANVGLSDVPGAVLCVAAMAGLVAAWNEPRRAWLGAVLTAVAVGARPQGIAALAPFGAALLARLLFRRRFRELALALVAGAAASAAVWMPAILLTGPARFLKACRLMAEYIKVTEVGYRFPGARLGPAADHWLQRPFGAPFAAGLFWLLVLVGAATWWRAGRRRLVAVAGSAVVCYLVVSAWTLNYTTAVRYALPALPFAALLASGCLAARRRGARLTAVTVVGLWVVGEAIWGAPVYLLRREPAPVWSTLQWAATHFDPKRTTVVYPEGIAPHSEWTFRRAGFTIVKSVPGQVYDASLRPDGTVIVVSSWQIPGTRVVHSERWRNGRLVRLTRDRYYDCSAAVAAPAAGPAFSLDFTIHDESWVLWNTGAIRLGPGGAPGVLRVTPGNSPLTIRAAGWARLKVDPGETRDVLLAPGGAGEVLISAPPRARAELAPLAVLPAEAAATGGPVASAYVVPVAAHRPGLDGAAWRTDLWLFNPGPASLPLEVSFLATRTDNRRPPQRALELPPGRPLVLDDVLAAAAPAERETSGALVVRASAASAARLPGTGRFVLLARTFDAGRKGAHDERAETLPGVPLEWGLAAGGEVRFGGVASLPGVRVQIGMASLCAAPIETRVDYLDADERGIARQRIDVPVFGHVQVPARAVGRGLTVRVPLGGAAAGCRVYPYLSVVDEADHRVQHVLPGVVVEEAGGPAAGPPLPDGAPARAGGAPGAARAR